MSHLISRALNDTDCSPGQRPVRNSNNHVTDDCTVLHGHAQHMSDLWAEIEASCGELSTILQRASVLAVSEPCNGLIQAGLTEFVWDQGNPLRAVMIAQAQELCGSLVECLRAYSGTRSSF